MSTLLALIAAVLAVLGQTAAPPPTVEQLAEPDSPKYLRLGVLSFNIRYGTAPDKENAWPHRKDQVFDIVRDERLDFTGLQEALRSQIDEIRAACPKLGEVGVGREDGKEKGEYAAILYRSDRWKVDSSGNFWLSETPEVPNSKSWKTAATRICTWARFAQVMPGTAASAHIWVFNTHMDHVSAEARLNGAKLIARRIAERGTPDQRAEPFILTGDFNSDEKESAARYFTAPPSEGEGKSPLGRLEDTFRSINPAAEDSNTFNGWDPTKLKGKKIDYVLVQPGTVVLATWIDRRYKEGKPPVCPSDHFPIGAVIQYEVTPPVPQAPPPTKPASPH